ncbi:MAG: GAF domain-containing protein [Acidobacteriota bacterium]
MRAKTPSDGDQLAHYRLLEKVGEGGMGIVYKAWDTKLERVVALKLLKPEILRHAGRRARLLREARIASSLNHPYIATIYGLEQADGQDIIAMEYVEGRTLGARLKDGPMELREALELSMSIADALGEAHADGVVHRDIKPDNVILTPRGYPKVMDFGLAKIVQPYPRRSTGSATTHLTAEGMAMGTVAYMSPEQAVGGEVDSRSDIFSFGVVLYEMLTQQRAFTGDSDVDILYEILHHTPTPVSDLNPDVPADLQAIIDRCTAKEPRERYRDGRELFEHLRLARVNLDVQRQRTLHTLLTISREMTSILDLEPLLDRIATLTKSLIDHDMLGIFRADLKRNRLYWLGGIGYDAERARRREYRADEGVCGRAIRGREPVRVGDVRKDPEYYPPNGEPFLSNMAVPLIHKDEVIGVLNMESRRPHAFTNEHVTIMTTLAGPIAVAIVNAGLFGDRRQHALAMEMLHQIGNEIASILDLESLLERAGQLTRKVIDYDLFTVFLLDEEGERFSWKTAIGYDPESVRGIELRMGQGIISRAAMRRAPALVDEVSLDPEYIPVRTADGRQPRSELAVPILARDRVLGVLVLESVEPAKFRPEDAGLMTVLASQVAVAIENARLYREIHDRAEAQEREAERIRKRFESYVTPHIAEQVFRDPHGKILAGERRPVTVLVADIRGFTRVAEALPEADAVRFLQEFFSVMSHIVFKYEGTVDKFIGDALMAFYGAPLPHDPRYGPSDAQRAVFAALDMRDAYQRLRDKWWQKHDRFGALELCVGINTGICLLGNMGSDKRVEYTAVGRAVNEAFRLCREADPGEIRIGERTHQDVHEDIKVEPVGKERAPGEGRARVVLGLKYFP